jgi:hypothetical protein
MVFDQYPGDHSQYPLGTPSQYPYPKQDFQEYSVDEVITQSSAKDPTKPLMATSGALACKTIDGVKQGFTNTHNFRMLFNVVDSASQKTVRITDNITTVVARATKIQSGAPSWAGIHIFNRYQTSDDLYVASWRFDGLCTFKKKIKGKYTTLDKVTIGAPQLGSEHILSFEINGNLLSFFIDGQLILQTQDNDLQWGTSGLRSDYCDLYADYIKIMSV